MTAREPDPYFSRVRRAPGPVPMPRWAQVLAGVLGLVIVAGGAALMWGLVGPLFGVVTPLPDAPARAYAPQPSPDDPGPEATTAAGMALLAIAVSTALAPTPTPLPPPPTYVRSTEVPPLLCGPWVQVGHTCTQPPAPTSTPTPLPDCPTTPGDDCRWMGVRATPLPVATTEPQGAAR